MNEICEITLSARERLQEVEALKKQGIEVYFVGPINPIHAQHVEGLYGRKLPGYTYFSCDKGENGLDLYDELFSELQQQNVRSEEVVVFHEGPVFNSSCFINLSTDFSFRLALLTATSSLNFEYCKLTKQGALTKALTEMGWLPEAKPVMDDVKTFTPARQRHNSRYWFRQPPIVIDLTDDSQPVKTRYT